MKGENPVDLPDEQTKKRIAEEIQRSNKMEADKKARLAQSVTEKNKKDAQTSSGKNNSDSAQSSQKFSSSYKESFYKETENQETKEKKPVNKIFGGVEPKPLYVPTYRRNKEERKTKASSRYRVLPVGSRSVDYIIQLPLVLKRLFVDLRDPIPLLDKLLFFAVFIVAYFVTVLTLVLHYKFIEPDTKYIIDVANQQVEIIIKKEDIPDLRKTLGPNWLQKLGRQHLEQSKN